MSKISILIPVYKGAETLNKCISSCLNQTHKNIEIIIVIDGSPDISIDIALKLQKTDQRIQVINKKNEGLPKTRRVAFENSTGEYIYHLDQDDYLSPEALEILLDSSIKTNADIVVCGSIYEDKQGKYITQWISNIEGSGRKEYLNCLFLGKLQHNIWGKLIKRDIYKSVELIEYTGGEDYLATVMMICYNENIKIHAVPQLLHHYIVHSESLTNIMQAREFVEFTDKIEDILVKTDLEQEVMKTWAYFRIIKCWRYYLRTGGKEILKNKDYVTRLYEKYYSVIKYRLSFFERIELNMYLYNQWIAWNFSRIYCKVWK